MRLRPQAMQFFARLVICGLFPLVVAEPTSADSLQLIADCKLHQSKKSYSGDEIYSVILCYRFVSGFISGAMASEIAGQYSGRGKEGLICYPEGFTIEQAIAVFVGWSDRNPKFWNRQEWENMYAAHYEAFPCK